MYHPNTTWICYEDNDLEFIYMVKEYGQEKVNIAYPVFTFCRTGNKSKGILVKTEQTNQPQSILVKR